MVTSVRVARSELPRWSRAAVVFIVAVVVVGLIPGVRADGVEGSAVTETAILIATTQLSQLAQPSIDASGVVYLPHRDSLLIADSEIDEESGVFEGVNLFEVGTDGSLRSTGVTPDTGGKLEPTGLAYDAALGYLLVSNDSTDQVTQIDSGADGVFGNADDEVTIPDYGSLGIDDLEDVAFDSTDRRLLLLDASDHTIFSIWPGANGSFDGLPPHGDDGFTTIDLAALGIVDATGLGYRKLTDTLLVTDSSEDAIFEMTTAGVLLRQIDISFLKIFGVPLSPTDVTIGPASDGSGADHMYVVDRGANNGTPDDGIPPPFDAKLYELTAPFENGVFDDDDGSIFEADIEWLAAEDITRGCNPPANNLFCPTGLVTRGQMAAFLVRGLDLTSGAGSDQFVDDDDSIFEADIEILAAAGITLGCNPPQNDRYCPDEAVTRAQMAAFLVRAIGYTFSLGDLFVDDNGSVFEADIDKLGTAGVTHGCNPPTNDRYCPGAFVTRAQMAAFLHRALG